jgi:hypothetical protein
VIFVFSFIVGVCCFAAKTFFLSKRKAVTEKQKPDVVDSSGISPEKSIEESWDKFSEETISQYIAARKLFSDREAVLRTPFKETCVKPTDTWGTIKNASPGCHPTKKYVHPRSFVPPIPPFDDDERRSKIEVSLNDWYRITDGTHVIRFLPVRESNPIPFITRMQHYVNGYGNGPVQCKKKCVDGQWIGDCPLCNHYRQLISTSENLPYAIKGIYDREILDLRPRQRYYYNVLVTLPGGRQEIKLLSLSAFVHDQIASQEHPLDHISHAYLGRNVTIKKRPVGKMGFPAIEVYVDTKKTNALNDMSYFSELVKTCKNLNKLAEQWEVNTERYDSAIATSNRRIDLESIYQTRK